MPPFTISISNFVRNKGFPVVEALTQNRRQECFYSCFVTGLFLVYLARETCTGFWWSGCAFGFTQETRFWVKYRAPQVTNKAPKKTGTRLIPWRGAADSEKFLTSPREELNFLKITRNTTLKAFAVAIQPTLPFLCACPKANAIVKVSD